MLGAKPFVTVVFGAIVGLVICAGDAFAYPAHRRLFQLQYGMPTRCDLCHLHGSGSERNGYGNDWAKAGQSARAFSLVEKLDSDGDGASNGAEIAGRSNPGDPRSTLANPGDTFQKAEEIPLPTEQLSLVFGDASAFEASEPDLTPAEVQKIEQGAQSTLSAEDQLPTLYFAVQGAARHGAALFRHYIVGGQHFSMLMGIDEQGRVQKALMFRAGNLNGLDYAPYLDCLRGHGATDVPDPGTAGCAPLAANATGGQATARAVRTGLWTVRVLLDGETQRTSAENVAGARTGETNGETPPAASSTAAHAAAETGAKGAAARSDPNRDETRSATLNLSRVKATSRTMVTSRGVTLGGVVASLVVWLGLIVVTVRFAKSSSPDDVSWPRLSALPPSAKVVAMLTFLSFLLVLGVGATDAYVQTRVVHRSALEYFQYLSVPRLIGTTHSHIFGFAVAYGAIGFLVTTCEVEETFKAALIAVMLWSGLFDVVSWWAMKELSASFEILAMVTGTASGLGALVSFGLVGKDLFFPMHTVPRAQLEVEPSTGARMKNEERSLRHPSRALSYREKP